MERKPGFYWLKDEGEWVVAEWDASSSDDASLCWLLPGSLLEYPDSMFEEIGSRKFLMRV